MIAENEIKELSEIKGLSKKARQDAEEDRIENFLLSYYSKFREQSDNLIKSFFESYDIEIGRTDAVYINGITDLAKSYMASYLYQAFARYLIEWESNKLKESKEKKVNQKWKEKKMTREEDAIVYGNTNTGMAFGDIMTQVAKQSPVTSTPKWVPCSKQLPKENEYVDGVAKYYFVQNEYGDMLVAKYVKKDYWEEIYSRHKLGATDKIVAWMPLPKKYKAETEKGENK